MDGRWGAAGSGTLLVTLVMVVGRCVGKQHTLHCGASVSALLHIRHSAVVVVVIVACGW